MCNAVIHWHREVLQSAKLYWHIGVLHGIGIGIGIGIGRGLQNVTILHIGVSQWQTGTQMCYTVLRWPTDVLHGVKHAHKGVTQCKTGTHRCYKVLHLHT